MNATTIKTNNQHLIRQKRQNSELNGNKQKFNKKMLVQLDKV